MPKVPRIAATRVRDAANPIVPGTPISRRLRSRAAEDTIKSSVANEYSTRQGYTSTDFDSDSDDFVLKKPKPKSKTRKTAKKPKGKKNSVSKPQTDTGESSQSETKYKYKNKGPYKSEDLDSQSDANEKIQKTKSNSKNWGIKCGDGVPVTLDADTDESLPTVSKENHQIVLSSSEEYKTPEDGSKKQRSLVDVCNEAKIPDIVEEFSNGNIKFIAKNSELQQVEMRERKRLLEIRRKLDEYIRKFKMDSITKTLELTKVFGNVLLCDVLEQINNPSSLDEMVSSLKKVKITADINRGKLAVISEDSEKDFSDSKSDVFKTSDELTPKSKAKYSFPRPYQVGKNESGLRRNSISKCQQVK